MNFPTISLKAARINMNLTQRDAAAKLGIDRATLQHYESGDTVPNWAMVKKIEELYAISADYLRFTPEYA